MSLLAERKRRETLALLERSYDEIKRDVLRSTEAKLRSKGITDFSSDLLEEYYNRAWWALYSKGAEGGDLNDPGGFLVTYCWRRAIDELRHTRPGRRVDALDVEERGAEQDFAAEIDRQRIIRQFTEGAREKLTERECQVVALCWIAGYTRPEAARILDLPEGRIQRIMDAATPKIAEFTQTIRNGEWCKEHESMMRAYAHHLLRPGGERHRLAEHHLADCPSCRRFVRTLEGLAALIPPVALPMPGSGVGSAPWHVLNQKVAFAWRHQISTIGPHVVLGHSAAAAGAGAGGGGGSAAGGGAATGKGLLAGTAGKALATAAVLAVGGGLAVGASHIAPVRHRNDHQHQHAPGTGQVARVAPPPHSGIATTASTAPPLQAAAKKRAARRPASRSRAHIASRARRARRQPSNAEFVPEGTPSSLSPAGASQPTQTAATTAGQPPARAPAPATSGQHRSAGASSGSNSGCAFSFECP